jgi:hypothetical protein
LISLTLVKLLIMILRGVQEHQQLWLQLGTPKPYAVEMLSWSVMPRTISVIVTKGLKITGSRVGSLKRVSTRRGLVVRGNESECDCSTYEELERGEIITRSITVTLAQDWSNKLPP